ncbi:MAG: SPASM domain-containing protein, partial [Promethearchaeota archaeon]
DLYHKLLNAGIKKFIITQHGPKISPNMRELFRNIQKNSNQIINVTDSNTSFSQKLFFFLKERFYRKITIQYQKFDSKIPLYNRGGLVEPEIVNYKPRCDLYDNPLVIDYDGNVILCCNDYLSSIKFGNLEKKSLMSIWNSKNYRKIRRQLRKQIYSLPICKRCTGRETG